MREAEPNWKSFVFQPRLLRWCARDRTFSAAFVRKKSIGGCYKNGPGTAKYAQIDLARGFARGLPDNNPGTYHGIFSGRLSIQMTAMVGVGECSWIWGSGEHTRLFGADNGNREREHPRVSARSHVAPRDAHAPRPAPTHPTTRPVTSLDVPSRLGPAAGARCQLLVHVDKKPPVLSEARRWVL